MGAIDLSSLLWPDADQGRIPQGLPGINREEFPECVYAGTMASRFHNLAGPERATLVNTTPKATADGAGALLEVAGVAQGYINTGYIKNAPNGERTYLLVGNLPANANGYGRVWTRNDAQEQLFWDGTYLTLLFGNNNPMFSFPAQRLSLVISVKDGRQLVYNRGVLVYEGAGSVGYTGNAYPLLVGNRTAGDRPMYGPVNAFAVFDKAYDNATCQDLSRNPASIFHTPTLGLFVPVAGGGGGLNVATALGAGVADGFASQVDRQRSFIVSAVQAVASGFPAGVDRQFNLSMVLGPASGTGLVAGVDRQLGVVAQLATVVAAGVPVGVDRQHLITSAIAQAVAAGLQATISVSGAMQINATLAVAAAAGLPLTVDQQHVIAANIALGAASGMPGQIDRQRGITLSLGQAQGAGIPVSIGVLPALNITGSLAQATAFGLTIGVDRKLEFAAAIGIALAQGLTATVDNLSYTLSPADIAAIAAAVWASPDALTAEEVAAVVLAETNRKVTLTKNIGQRY